MATVLAVSHLYSTHLVEIPHAEDSRLAQMRLSAKEALEHLKADLSDYRELAKSPDTSFDMKSVRSMEDDVSQVLDAAAWQLQGTREELLRSVRRSDQNEMH